MNAVRSWTEPIGSPHGTRHHTPTHVNELRFRYQLDAGDATLRPIVDGLDMLQSYRNDQGLSPDRLLPPLSSLLLPTRSDRRVLIGCCSCGETGCGSLGLRLRRLGSEVLWEPDERSQYESLSRSLRFDLRQYLDAVDDAAEDRPGEGRGSRVSRQVRLMLGLYDQAYDSLTLFQVAKVDWISGWPWESDVVKVSLTSETGQEVAEFSAALGESDREFATRVAAHVNDRRLGRASSSADG